MATYNSVTVMTLPLLPLFFKEFIDAFISDVYQVLNHAHVVFGPVTLIKCFKSAAGEVLAFITKPYKSLSNEVAMLFHENTVLATRQATEAVSPFEAFFVQVILQR
jgi:hypothetical protein